MPGLAHAIIRQPSPDATALPDGIVVEIANDQPSDAPEIDERGNILEIRHGDGSISVSLDGKPLGEPEKKAKSGWFSNLVDDIDAMELGRISDDLLRRIIDDLESRKDWIEAREQGIRLLGTKLEMPGVTGVGEGAPVEGMSRVRHPLLLEAVLRGQANARSELLPTDGPMKIRNDDSSASVGEDQLANALETDMNHYLTVTASEYYPDTDRMLLMLFAGGTCFKKVYYCPLRSRPVSESVDADDLIVNETATDLRNARRVTHRSMMSPSTVKRLQILGVYRDISLSAPVQPTLDSVQREKKEQQGVTSSSMTPDDRDREIYECYCELDLKGFEHTKRGLETGLEIPYVVTIDVSSKEILSVVRNYNEDTKELPEARTRFAKYTFVPGFGFYDIGLINILGNTTNALTAAWRELLDMGMFANFPGFLIAKAATKQNTSILRVPPGGGQQVDTQGMDISKAIMPLPYNAQGMPALMSLVGDISQTGMRIGGTSEQQVGEGRADAPVGTTLAMIEQAEKIMNAVHKRLHASQCEEFRLLIECFREHPESFWRRKCKSKQKWDEVSFLKALDNCNLTPQADPNTASHGQRMMKLQALAMLAQAQPQLYDPILVNKALVAGIGFKFDDFAAPASSMGQPTPQQMEVQAKTKMDADRGQAALITAQARVTDAQTKASGAGQGGQQRPDPAADMTARARLIDAQTKQHALKLDATNTVVEDHNRDLDRQAKEREAVMSLAKEVMMSGQNAGPAVADASKAEKGVAAP